MQWKAPKDPEQKKLDKGWHLKFAWAPTKIYKRQKPCGTVVVWLEWYWRCRTRPKRPNGFRYNFWRKAVRSEVPDGVEVTHTRCGEHVTNLR